MGSKDVNWIVGEKKKQSVVQISAEIIFTFLLFFWSWCGRIYTFVSTMWILWAFFVFSRVSYDTPHSFKKIIRNPKSLKYKFIFLDYDNKRCEQVCEMKCHQTNSCRHSRMFSSRCENFYLDNRQQIWTSSHISRCRILNQRIERHEIEKEFCQKKNFFSIRFRASSDNKCVFHIVFILFSFSITDDDVDENMKVEIFPYAHAR